MSDHLYCEDCKFCEAPRGEMVFARCAHPNASKTLTPDRYVARQFDKPAYASTMRDMENKCGPGADWFEQRETYTKVKSPSDIIARIMGNIP